MVDADVLAEANTTRPIDALNVADALTVAAPTASFTDDAETAAEADATAAMSVNAIPSSASGDAASGAKPSMAYPLRFCGPIFLGQMREVYMICNITQSLTVDFPLQGNVGSFFGVHHNHPVSV